MTPAQRSANARIAALTLHSQVDSRQHTVRARRGAFARFEAQVDPEGVLAPEERERRARLAQRAHMSRIAMLSAQRRRLKT